ncbi:MAG: hypothetical protein M3Q92_14035, partial [Actinomycetota bacterium]|nr:hypothetical protein [Actinomycetota bacterium]
SRHRSQGLDSAGRSTSDSATGGVASFLPSGAARVLLTFGAVDWHVAFDLGELDPRRAHELVVDVVDPAESGHPSVVLWIVINEDWGRPPTGFQRRLVQGVRAQDPGRLVVDASGWKQLDGTDLVDRHDYGDDL